MRFLRIFTKIKIRGVGEECSGWGGQGGCERRIEVFGKIHKKIGGGGSGGGSGGGRVVGVRVDVNAMLGVGVMWSMGDVDQE